MHIRDRDGSAKSLVAFNIMLSNVDLGLFD